MFPTVRQGAFVIDGIEQKFGDWDFSRGRGFVETADDLSPENPKIADMFADGAARKLDLDQMIDKGEETLDELFTGRNVFGESHPSVRPFVEVLAAWQPSEGPVRGVSCGRSFVLTLLDNHGTNYDFKPMLSLFGVRL